MKAYCEQHKLHDHDHSEKHKVVEFQSRDLSVASLSESLHAVGPHQSSPYGEQHGHHHHRGCL